MIKPPADAAPLANLDLGPVIWFSHLIVLVADASGELVDVNPEFRRLADIPIGAPVADIVGVGQRPAFREWVDALGPRWKTHTWGVLPDDRGMPRDVRITGCRDASGRVVLIGERLQTDDLSAALLDVNETLVAEHRRLARERKRLDQEVRLDALTGLANRRSFDRRLAHEIERAKRSGRFAIVMIDIDHFKAINDRFGHAAGDRVLRWFGERLRAAARQGDFVGRYGGEEFVAILPDAGAEGAMAWAERLRAVMRTLPAPVEWAVTASIGVAAWSHGETGGAVVSRADRGLYAAKSSGRDRVVVVEPDTA